MSSRGKKCVKLATKHISEANQSIYENVDDVEDPWMSYKEWQFQNKIKNTQIENADEKFNATTDRNITSDVSKLAPEILNKSILVYISRPEKLLENNNEFVGNVGMEDKLASKPLYIKDEHIAGNVSKLNSGIYNLNINQPSTSLEDNSELDTSDENDSSLSWHPNEDGEELSSETENSVDSCEDLQNDNKVEKVEKNNVIQNEKCITILKDVLIREGTTTYKGKFSVEKKIECSLRKGRVWNKKDRCSYCNLDVTNFSRHLFRKHSSEESVKQILLLKKGDIKRKHMIDLLRKEGNFSVLNSENLIRAVQRPTAVFENNNLSSDYLPCKYCKGLYKTQSLKRHAKACFFNNEKMNGMKYASEGQTMVAFTASRKKFLDRLRLKSEVFNTMQADRISLNCKSDILICQYAEDFLRKHKRPQIKHAVSNKIREFGRLLIPLQDIPGGHGNRFQLTYFCLYTDSFEIWYT